MRRVASGRTGDAYLLVDVNAGKSDEVAAALLQTAPLAIRYSAAVWGPWDVIARVTTEKLEDLLTFVDNLRGKKEDRILRTETWWIRHDQLQAEEPNLPDRLAFVMMRVDPSPGVEAALDYLYGLPTDNDARIWHLAGVLGPYDIAATIGYRNDRALRQLVMERMQGRFGIKETLTILGIEGMNYPKTHKISIKAESMGDDPFGDS